MGNKGRIAGLLGSGETKKEGVDRVLDKVTHYVCAAASSLSCYFLAVGVVI